ncbi:MAG: TetR family transcriptional regulator C-terminal domain-containing protein [Bacilli bacterium]|jgi:AcrR family transcriptional regulator|nr:TetR family transcriptional regulator C-terminal domain-containing protein [Bacilli bacterium]MCH4202183.1 TetR family transcriptional regulator C-terminal domain-containing protein [Bacilli bacterium]
MKTELKLGEALKHMMAVTPLDEITVKRLTDYCHVYRQTFYYHFRNIYDLLTWIYLNESVKNLDQVANWDDALKFIFQYVRENSSFVQNTLSSAGRELFIEFLYSTTFATQLEVINKLPGNELLSEEQKRFISNFYAPSFVYMVVRWIDGGMKDDPETLVRECSVIADNYLEDAIKKFTSKRKDEDAGI